MTNNYNNSKGRLIGLLASAKAVRQEGDTLDETARKAIVLYDLLIANANNPTVIPREESLRYGKIMTDEQREQIKGLIRDNKLDPECFKTWLGTIFPEVKAGGIRGLTADHARHILDHAEACVKKFNASLASESEEGDG